MPQSDIAVAILTRDPYFLFAARSLLGRDRRTRVVPDLICGDLRTLEAKLKTSHSDILIVDLDSFQFDNFYVELRDFVHNHIKLQVMCLVESCLPFLSESLFQLPIRGVFAKSDLAYALHIAAHTMIDTSDFWITEKIHVLCNQVGIAGNYRVVKSEIPYPALSEAVAKVVHLRVVIGLDNPDIIDELVYAEGTAKKFMRNAYKAFGITDKVNGKSKEFRIFEILSNWWRVHRFGLD